ncbi:MAG: hypothetical protein KDI30_02755 [Pseudomonadales bacterium]|nr:hypothetical protein [Pseudomonadales bacterium]
MKAVIIVSLVVVLGVMGGYGYKLYESHHAYKSTLEGEIRELKTQVRDLQALVKFQDERIAALEKTSINKLVDDANNMFIEGWESMLNTLETELDKAREKSATQP